ncbi:Surp module [Teratosphaeria nubilosa]|uniref:Surp module n=1 Tax=Teratosphaeria nubilosa TaxID=161662 RepID=A0A6G1KUC8_9PEZI|nr:Surp module [Teratosphaeria nubilosa]
MAPDGTSGILDEISSKAPPGTVLPPRNVRELIEKTAGYVARNGPSFEERLRDGAKTSGKAAFLIHEDPYYPYYQWRLAEIKAGKGNVISAGRQHEAGANGETGVSGKGREERKGPDKPDDFAFSARMPNISAQDLEIVKLTALFVAKNGRSWMTALSQREAGNFQFDFLRPQHSLYQFFSRLVDQYTTLLNGDTVDEGRPQKKRIVELEANVHHKFHVLERAKKRAEYVKWQEQQKVAKEEQDEKERIAFLQIDWQDFVVVETVVFDDRDEEAALPPPTSKNDLQSASLEQKAAMSIDPNRRLEEAMPTFDDQPQWNAYGQQQPPSAAPVPMPPPQQYGRTPPPATPYRPPPGADDEAGRMAEVRADRERARAAQEAARSNASNPKIRHDYVPRAQAKRQAANTSLCPNCGQAIPNDEIDQHIRIEMLDPRWRDQARINQQRSSTTIISTQDVANNLKRFASQRTDLFDAVTGQALSEEEQERRKRAELGAYDGVSAVSGQVGGGGGFVGQGGVGAQNLQEQVAQLHQKYGQGQR